MSDQNDGTREDSPTPATDVITAPGGPHTLGPTTNGSTQVHAGSDVKDHVDSMLVEIQHRPLGGAKTFDEADASIAAMALDHEVRDIEDTYWSITDNIRSDVEMDALSKARAIETAAGDLARRLEGVDMPVAGTGFAGLDSGFKAWRDQAGDMRWLAIYTNKYKDKEGEIFTDEAHKEFVDFVDRTGAYPPLRIWHIPVNLGMADQLDYTDEGFMVATGTFSKEHEHVGEALAEMEDLACSHGFNFMLADKPSGEYKTYRSFEITALPRWAASNELTAFEIGAEIPMIGADPKKRAFFEHAFRSDEDPSGVKNVQVIDERLAGLSRYAADKGIDYKQITDLLNAGGRGTEEAPTMEQGTKDGATAVAEPVAPAAVTEQKDDDAAEGPAGTPEAAPVQTVTPGAAPAEGAPAEAAAADETGGDAQTTASDDDPATDPAALVDPNGEAQATEALKSILGPIVATATKEALTAALSETSARLDGVEEAVKAIADSQDVKVADLIRPKVGPTGTVPASTAGEGIDPATVPEAIAAQTKAADGPVHAAQPYADDLLRLVGGRAAS